jgi:glycosyltransferase involved in cell wall biosynthesis
MPKKKTRVAFCMRDMQLGGAEAVLVRTLEGLMKRGDLDISIVSYVDITESIYKNWLAQHFEIKHVVLYPCSWLGTKLKRFFLVRIFQHLLRDVYRFGRRALFNDSVWQNYDVIVDYYDFGFHQELKKVQKQKIAWWHSSINKFVSGAKNYTKYLESYDKFVALTDGFVDDFKKQWTQFADKILRVYNPLNVADIVSRAESGDVFPGNYFVSVARLSADKDVVTVLHAFDKFYLDNNNPAARLVLVGGGDIDKYRKIADKCIASKNIVFLGAQSNPFGYMRGALANILSSYSEGLPTVLLESIAVKTLNIASDCKNGPREILLDGKAGLLYVPGDVDGLAQHMSDVWQNKTPTKRMIDTASKSLDRFDVKNIVAQVLDLFTH